MRRVLLRSAWVAGVLLSLVLLLGGAAWLTGNTGMGRNLIERMTYRLSGGDVKLSGLGGTFPAIVTVDELQIRDARGVWLDARHLSLQWSPLALLSHRVQVERLQAAYVHIERSPVGDPQGGSVSIPHIEVADCAIEVLELGAPLVGTPAKLSLMGNARVRSLQDVSVAVKAHRIDGVGDYEVHLRFDPKRMDGSLKLHEPAGGPLEHLVGLPGLGVLSAVMSLSGPRTAERVDLVLDAGELHARAQGSLDLVRQSADLDYSLVAPAMSPRSDLAWQSMSLSGRWHGDVASPTADGRLQVAGLRLAGGAGAGALSADLAAHGGILSVKGTITALEVPGPGAKLFAKDPLAIDASMHLNQASRPLELRVAHRLFSLHAHAETAGEQSAALELRLLDVAPFAALAGQDVRGDAAVTARIVRRPGDFTLTLDAKAGLSGGTPGWLVLLGDRARLELSAAVSDGSVQVDRLRLTGRAITLAANGSAVRSAQQPRHSNPQASVLDDWIKDVQARWQLDVADLRILAPELAGNLKMSGRLSGAPAALTGDAELTSTLSVRGSAPGTVSAALHAQGLPTAPRGTLQAHGMLDGSPLQLDVAAERGTGNVVRALIRRAEWKSAHAQGDLTVGAALSQARGGLRVGIEQLSDLDRLLGIDIKGSVDGNIAFAPAGGHTRVELQLMGHDLVAAAFAGDARLQGQGAADALEVTLTAHVPELRGAAANLSSTAVLNLDQRTLRLVTAAADYRGQSIHLMSPAQLSFADGISIDRLQIGAQDAVFELDGRLAPSLDLRASLRDLKPALVNVFVPGLLQAGTIVAQARLGGSLAAPTGPLVLDATGIRLGYDATNGLPALDLQMKAQLAGNTAALDAGLHAGTASRLTVSGSAPLRADGLLDLKVLGKLDAGLVNPLLEAHGLRAAGQLAIDALLSGAMNAPQVAGSITLEHGNLRDYGRGINLSDISARVVGSAGTLQIEKFQAAAGSGSVEMSGSIGVLQPGIPVNLKIDAHNAQPIASNILTVNLDADLSVRGRARERLDVTGTVHVDRAVIGIPNSLPPQVAVLDVRRRGAPPPAAAEKRLVIGMDVQVQAPQEILVQGRGLDAELGGDLHVTGTTDVPLVSGGFDLQRGSFNLVGNKLSFTVGRVSFDSAGLKKTIDPTLDFTAETTVSNVTATLHITGLADAPRFELSSVPTLPQDEIMGKLLFGENAQQLTALQAAQIGAALATLSGIGGNALNPLVKLQKTLGLDRLSVGANSTNTASGTENSGAAIAAGRYLSKRVYIEGKQTTTGTSQVQVDVDLSKHLKLQTRLGNGTAITQGTTPENDPGSSIGLSYQFEY